MTLRKVEMPSGGFFFAASQNQHCQRLQSVFEEDETEEATEKKIRYQKNLKN